MKKKISKRNDILFKYSDILKPKYVYMKLIPSSSVVSYDSSKLSLLVNELFKNIKDRIHFIEKRFFLEEKTSIRYMIDVSKEKVEFYYIIPEIYKDLAIDTIAKIWNGRCSVQEIKKSNVRVLDNPTIYQMRYKYEDSLSLRTDKRSNKFLSRALSVVEIIGEEDVVQLVVNLVPYNRSPSGWRTYCDENYDRFKKNLSIQKTRFDFNYFLNLLIASLGEFVNLILPEALRSSIDYTISGKEKSLSSSSKSKARDSSKIINTQIAVLGKSSDKKNEVVLVKSFCNSFSEVAEDNEMVSFKTSMKKSKVSIHNANWNIYENKMSSDELSNFITIAGQKILQKFKNIEHIAVKQVPIIPELTKGIIPLGGQDFKSNKQDLYLSEVGELGKLPLVILTMMGGGKTSWLENIGVALMTHYKKSLKENKKVPKESLFCIDYVKQNELSYNIINHMDPEDVILIDLSTPEGIAKLGLGFKEAECDRNNLEQVLFNASTQGTQMMQLINLLNMENSQPLSVVMTRYLNSAFLLCYIHKNKSLRDALGIIEDYEERHRYIDMIPEELKKDLEDEVKILLELDDEDNKTKINLISGILSRTYTLQLNPILKRMYNTKLDTVVNFADAMQEGKGIFILMPSDIFSKDIINIISTYIISRLYFACLKRGVIKSSELTRCTLIMDEINIAPGCLQTMKQIVSELRKYKLRPIMSAHNLSQLGVLKKNLISAGASIILPQGTDKDNFLAFEKQFKEEGFYVEDLYGLKSFQTLNLIMTTEGMKAFVCTLPAPLKGKIDDANQKQDISFEEFKSSIVKRVSDANTKNNNVKNLKKKTKKVGTGSKKTNYSKNKASEKNKNNSLEIDKYIAFDKCNQSEEAKNNGSANSKNSGKSSVKSIKIKKDIKNSNLSLKKQDSKKNQVLIDLNDEEYDSLFEDEEFRNDS